MPRLCPRTCDPVARRRGRHRPPPCRARRARRLARDHHEAMMSRLFSGPQSSARQQIRINSGRTKAAGPPANHGRLSWARQLNGNDNSNHQTRERGFSHAEGAGRSADCFASARGLKRPAPAVLPTIVGVKKCAVYRDGDGQFRVIEFFLPADLLTKLRRPIEIQFLEGEELVTAQQFDEAISSGFLNRASASPDKLRRAKSD